MSKLIILNPKARKSFTSTTQGLDQSKNGQIEEKDRALLQAEKE
jgi:hypothetical protein